MTDNCVLLGVRAYATRTDALNNPFYITDKNFETYEKFSECWLKKKIAPGYYCFKSISKISTGKTIIGPGYKEEYCVGDKCPFSFMSYGCGSAIFF